MAEGDGDQKKLLGESGIEAVIHFVRKPAVSARQTFRAKIGKLFTQLQVDGGVVGARKLQLLSVYRAIYRLT